MPSPSSSMYSFIFDQQITFETGRVDETIIVILTESFAVVFHMGTADTFFADVTTEVTGVEGTVEGVRDFVVFDWLETSCTCSHFLELGPFFKMVSD